MKYVKPERFFLKTHPELSEKWVQELVAADPSILGLGDLVLRDRERIHPRAGRLDLLLQEPESARRYEVELQLGATDEAHIIRTIEYWDIERKRYPQYEHCAVLVAEDITSRFLNVIALFNGTIPLIAIQMNAVRWSGDNVSLIFTKVMDELDRGLVDDDEDAEATANREYWEKRSSKATVQLADDILAIAKEFDPSLELKYNKFYIGLLKNMQPFNFIQLRPRKSTINLEVKIPRTAEVDEIIDKAGLETLEYNTRWGYYRLSLQRDDIARKRDVLKDLIGRAYQIRAT
jgi:hypothetical protein